MKNDKTDFRIGDMVYLLELDSPKQQEYILSKKGKVAFSKFGVIVDIEYPKDIKENEFSLLLQSFLKRDVHSHFRNLYLKVESLYMQVNPQGKNHILKAIGNSLERNLRLVARKIT